MKTDIQVEAVDRCLSGERESRLVGTFEHWSHQLGVRQCRACGLLYVSPRLTEDSIHRIFDTYYFRDIEPTYWGRRRLPVFRDVFRLIKRCGGRRVFDIGTAFGHFPAWLSQKGGRRAAGTSRRRSWLRAARCTHRSRC